MKTSEKTAEEKTHFYSLLTGAVRRLDFALHMIKVTQYLADVKHRNLKKTQNKVKASAGKKVRTFFSSLIPNSSNIDAFRWQPTQPTVPKHQYFRSWETQSYSVTIFPTRALKTEKDNFSNPPLRALAGCATYWSCRKRMPVLNRLKSRWWGGGTHNSRVTDFDTTPALSIELMSVCWLLF